MREALRLFFSPTNPAPAQIDLLNQRIAEGLAQTGIG